MVPQKRQRRSAALNWCMNMTIHFKRRTYLLYCVCFFHSYLFFDCGKQYVVIFAIFA
ncbi:MAG: hypothetical protein PWR15_1309 [Bacteroidota bacterium]|jgi:hypothetical protein|nr:hypothetical protein [Bacteroidota bacterium]